MHVKLDLKIILVLLIFFLTDQIEMYLLFMFFIIILLFCIIFQVYLLKYLYKSAIMTKKK